MLWELGPNVLLGVGDSLVDDWQARAIAERRETIELAARPRRDPAILRLLADLDRALDDLAAQHDTCPPLEPEPLASGGP